MKARIRPKHGEVCSMVSLFILIIVSVLWMIPDAAVAQQEDIVAAGKREFRGHCAVCHGLGGKGDSVMTTLNLLTVQPTDLTQLEKRNKSQFPFWQAYRIIDGREDVKGHGTRDMPIWGDVFTQQEGSTLADETHAMGRILAIIYYLQSIQEK